MLNLAELSEMYHHLGNYMKATQACDCRLFFLRQSTQIIVLNYKNI